jgi:hypothetical protein
VAIRFIGQPFDGRGQIGPVVSDALRVNWARQLWIATAWGKQSGLGRIISASAAFRDSGGASEVIVGIDEGGATREGLVLCLEMFDRVFVYHDPGPRTFHPKIYAVEGEDRATIVVGSGNLTMGGLFKNYEAAFVLETERGQPEWAVRGEVRSYFDALLGVGDAVRLLDAELIEQLAGEGWVTSETRQNRRRSAMNRELQHKRQQLFGRAVRGLAGAPASEVAALPAEEEDEDSAPPPGAAAVIDSEDAGIGVGTSEPEDDQPAAEEDVGGASGFWKRLSNWDASGSSAPGQIQIPIQFLDFFPNMTDEVALTAGLGQGQSAAYFDVEFRDGAFTKRVDQARVILYEPAPHHARPNREIRFTFHDHEVFERLSPLDVLVFTEAGGEYSVERRDPGAMGGGRWGWLE